MRERTWKAIGPCLVLCAALGSACRSPTPVAGGALSRWFYRYQGLVPVAPPREDVRVGDVHIYLSDPDAGNVVPLHTMPRWSSLPSDELLRAIDRDRPPNPATHADYLRTGLAPQERTWHESDEAGASRHHLRSIQLPTFVIDRDEPGELPAIWGLQVVLDQGDREWRYMRIGIEAAQSTSVALEDAIATYLERRGSRLFLPASLRRNLRALAPAGLETIWVRIVTEVVYMRAIRVTIVVEPEIDLFDEGVSSAELGLAGEPASELASELAEVDLDPTYAAIARANAMNARFIESGTDVLPDSFIRLLRVSDDAITARRVFRRPTAVGVGGISLRVDARTGRVEAMRLMGRSLAEPRVSGRGEDPPAIDADLTTPLPDDPHD